MGSWSHITVECCIIYLLGLSVSFHDTNKVTGQKIISQKKEKNTERESQEWPSIPHPGQSSPDLQQVRSAHECESCHLNWLLSPPPR
jgi:hypothetical protein